MSSIPRRTIDELLARYELEPTLRDLYVEGKTDKNLVDWFLGRCNIDDVFVYEIDVIEIPVIFEEIFHYASGNKGCVLTLSQQLERKLDNNNSAYFLIDRDFDNFQNITWESEKIFVTDYSCVESYFFKKSSIEKFFTVFLGLSLEFAEQFMGDACALLTELFLIRLAKQTLAPSMKWIDPRRCLVPRDGKLYFESNDFIGRLLNSNEWPVTQERFSSQVEEFRNQLSEDNRFSLHGHDFSYLLRTWVNSICGVPRALSDEHVMRGLMACSEFVDIHSELLFQKLEKVFSA